MWQTGFLREAWRRNNITYFVYEITIFWVTVNFTGIWRRQNKLRTSQLISLSRVMSFDNSVGQNIFSVLSDMLPKYNKPLEHSNNATRTDIKTVPDIVQRKHEKESWLKESFPSLQKLAPVILVCLCQVLLFLLIIP